MTTQISDELTDADKDVLAKLGDDIRVEKLFSLALTAYTFLLEGMFNLRTGKSTRQTIIETVESFGFRAVPIPWGRFPKRFHRNRPTLQLFKPELNDADIELYWLDVIEAQQPGPVKGRRKAKASPSASYSSSPGITSRPAKD